ncbi:ABC-F family ATP-binding cassette domain-containing protein [Sedimentibacter sp. zth1]|uniref:ribosomal protection-like ABC-F family protein n=1 Tax=Sedimentibacter sp. zth1 TaxID=2816908 RepID=UPI001A90EB62|nr:ATP-binding cassette domain-containing protein [Sedimentibacter sp. zth1]QSX05118.1 ABC-F family ATP-binding cassette domain-containing protein [Sedimentibacter sp. zth1]
MSKIAINELSYSFKEYYQPIFNNINISIDTNWKLGLIGRNGRGKTTLLKLISGELEPDKGHISKDINIEYFPYSQITKYIKTLDVIKENIGLLKTMEDVMDDIIKSNDEKRFGEYQKIFDNYAYADGFNIEIRIKKEFHLMNLSESLLEQDFDTLSGGEKTKMLIISLFLRKNSFVLLDEPTNHLDIEGKQVVQNYLNHKKGFILVSHDCEFVDDVVDHIISINKSDITIEKGNYSTWIENKSKSELFEFKTKERLEREIKSLEKNAVANRKWANVANKQKNLFRPYGCNSGRGNDAGVAKLMRQAKSSERTIQKNIEEKKNLLKNYEEVSDLSISQNALEDDVLVTIEKLSFGYSNKLILNKFSLQIRHGDIIWLRGKNGTGKSTLLKLITGEIYSDCLRFQEDIKISQSYQEPLWKKGLINKLIDDNNHSTLHFKNRFLNICKCLDIKLQKFEKPIEAYSSGEIRKIDIARSLATDNDLLLLDEPLNYMDTYFKEQLEKAILIYKPTLVFVEHDENFGHSIANRTVMLDK